MRRLGRRCLKEEWEVGKKVSKISKKRVIWISRNYYQMAAFSGQLK
jgi:hypothetical protein